MKKIFTVLLLAGAIAALSAADLTIAAGKKSNYQIVVPDSCGNKTVDQYVTLGGKVIQTALRKAAGVNVPLVTESRKLPGKPAIYVGNTKAAAKMGFSSKKFANWENTIAVRGKDIYCFGKDSGNPFKKSSISRALMFPTYFVHYVNGSLKAACTFTEKFLNTRFVIPKNNAYGEHDGVITLPKAKITVPEKFFFHEKPRFVQMADMGGLLYSVANNFLFCPGEAYNVHYHVQSIPQEKYFKTNPEYFALLKGKRFCDKGNAIYSPRPQYCLSNPEVQELIYKNALARADVGYKVVEFGQTDGFLGCECEPCKKMYNTSDWGEKLWRLHADMAARLEKERPGVIPAISCYGPTHNVPRTIKKFPTKNMIIDVCHPNRKLLAEWKKFNVKRMAAWTYYFGEYKASSYAPSASFEMLQNEVKWLKTTPITYLFNCGINFSIGLNGPWVYVFGKFLGDPNADWRKHLKEYCLFTYGAKAAPIMEKFFLLLNERSRKFPNVSEEDYNNFGRKIWISSDVLWGRRYTPAVLAQLEKYIAQAEKVWKKTHISERLKKEFNFFILTARVNNAANTLQKADSRANRLALADAIEKREAFLKTITFKRGQTTDMFHYQRLPNLRAGGSGAGLFQGAFNSDPKILRQKISNIELVKVKGFADPAWAKIPAQKVNPVKSAVAGTTAFFKAAYTDNALLLVCTAPLKKMPAGAAFPRDSMRLWEDAVWEIFITAGEGTAQMVFSARPNSAYDSWYGVYSKPYTGWDRNWTHKDTVKSGIWRSEVTIPLKSVMKKLPRKGENWYMQVAFSTPGAKELYAWNLPLSGAFSDISGFGAIRFGKRPAVQKFDISDLQNRRLWYSSSPKIKLQYLNSNGKKAVKFGFDKSSKLTWGALRNNLYLDLQSDEEAVCTVTLRGRGKGTLSAAWVNGVGKFAVNGGGSTGFTLSSKPQTVTNVIRLIPEVAQKGAKRFHNNIFLHAPGGEVIVEGATLMIRKRK